MLRQLCFLTLLCYFIALSTAREDVGSRWKRQSDASTEVVGLSLEDAATDGDYKTLKRGARSVSRPKEDRKRRQLFGNPLQQAQNTANLAAKTGNQATDVGTQVAGGVAEYILTAIQGIFNKINFDFALAQKLEEFVNKENSPVLKKMVVTGKNGVKCDDVCKGDNGYGTIGICTPKYCTCDYANKKNTELSCTDKNVFDTIGKTCKPPSETVLCSDDKSDDQKS